MTLTLMDGATGTFLAHQGLPTPAPLWATDLVRSHPDAVSDAHRRYAAAGATLHTALTFRAQARHAGPDATRLATQAVALARAAVPSHHTIAGSMAPLEDCWQPGRAPRSAWHEHHAVAADLADAGADLLLIETFAHPGETLAAVAAAKRTGLPTWVALTAGYDASLHTPRSLGRLAAAVADVGADALLINCTPAQHIRRYLPDFCAGLAAHPRLPWGVYANAGLPGDPLSDGQTGAAAAYAAHAKTWTDQGATLIGGCCGTGPDHIAALRSALDSAPSRPA